MAHQHPSDTLAASAWRDPETTVGVSYAAYQALCQVDSYLQTIGADHDDETARAAALAWLDANRPEVTAQLTPFDRSAIVMKFARHQQEAPMSTPSASETRWDAELRITASTYSLNLADVGQRIVAGERTLERCPELRAASVQNQPVILRDPRDDAYHNGLVEIAKRYKLDLASAWGRRWCVRRWAVDHPDATVAAYEARLELASARAAIANGIDYTTDEGAGRATMAAVAQDPLLAEDPARRRARDEARLQATARVDTFDAALAREMERRGIFDTPTDRSPDAERAAYVKALEAAQRQVSA